MPDLGEQLSQILNNPETRRNIENLMSQLQSGSGSAVPSPQQEQPPFDFSSLFGQSAPAPPPQNENPLAGIDIGMMMKLQSIFSKMNCDDQNVNLLRALRPHLKRPEKVDEAINILRLMSVLPALGEAGIFGGNFR
ncbi:MAG: hypothetical protein E7489_05715 [Ruminococcaceae bacterium]|nr:hypothetical protein [Oscillospiraceae bacterium]